MENYSDFLTLVFSLFRFWTGSFISLCEFSCFRNLIRKTRPIILLIPPGYTRSRLGETLNRTCIRERERRITTDGKEANYNHAYISIFFGFTKKIVDENVAARQTGKPNAAAISYRARVLNLETAHDRVMNYCCSTRFRGSR